MKSRITKFVVAAIIAIAAVLSVSIFIKSVPAAFGIEQVIDANNNIRFLHAKQFRANRQEPDEFWIKSDEQGRVAKARYYLPVTEDGVKLITWTPERTEHWAKVNIVSLFTKPSGLRAGCKVFWNSASPN